MGDLQPDPPLPQNPFVQKTSEPHWRPWRMARHGPIPAGVLPWLQDEGSLTRRMIQHCNGQFSVKVRMQEWGRPLASERNLLGMRVAASALIREVELNCGHCAWVFARTLIPASSLQGGARRLAHLGDKPLGAVLFADASVQRAAMQVACLQSSHALFRSAVDGLVNAPTRLWARRTLFQMEGKPLLVNEVFLPALPD
jgi:chorismate--pyruvate lyase